jgi:putative tricarboxylic transport membrane protein
MGWAPEGPQAGYFPFYLSLLLGGASLYGLVAVLRERAAGEPFLEPEQAQRVLRVLVPIVLFCAVLQVLGLYVASFALVTGFMRGIGGIVWWKSLLTGLAFTLALFLTFDVAFDVLMPKGPLEALLGR